MRKAPLVEMDLGTWATIALVAATAVAYLTLLFFPQMRAISNSHAELDTKLTYVMKAHKSARAADLIERELHEVQAYIEQHDDQLMAPDDLPSLFRQISHVCKSREAATTRFEPHPPVAYHSLDKASLNLSFQGPFPAVQGLLQDLELFPMRIWVDNIKMSMPQQTTETVECELHLVVFIDNPENTD
jgi:Tfp pilus assembly protein PilO